MEINYMKRTVLVITAIFVVAIATACTSQDSGDAAKKNGSSPQTEALSRPAKVAPAAEKTDSNGHDHSASRVPAFQTDALSLKTLGPTLPAEKFIGKTRAAYKAVKEIPRTIAQLPCYCYCDQGAGHKSLYSCFEDDHAAHCAVCVDEALLALRLEKEEKLRPEQIRERIIAQYSAQHH